MILRGFIFWRWRSLIQILIFCRIRARIICWHQLSFNYIQQITVSVLRFKIFKIIQNLISQILQISYWFIEIMGKRKFVNVTLISWWQSHLFSLLIDFFIFINILNSYKRQAKSFHISLFFSIFYKIGYFLIKNSKIMPVYHI